MSSSFTMLGQIVDISLTPVVPGPQVKRYDRHVPLHANYANEYKSFKVKKGLLDCSEELPAVEG
ncbi:hypothetical protein C8R48DRAFT_838095 [Suillus tomentosus]|nr:hypothetical protein C8R48DRAFT_838095 [Suillus tomentosus]